MHQMLQKMQDESTAVKQVNLQHVNCSMLISMLHRKSMKGQHRGMENF